MDVAADLHGQFLQFRHSQPDPGTARTSVPRLVVRLHRVRDLEGSLDQLGGSRPAALRHPQERALRIAPQRRVDQRLHRVSRPDCASAADLRLPPEGKKRALAVDRHQLSLQLPGLFRNLTKNKTVYHTERKSYFFVRNMSVPGKSRGNEPYVVFFRAFKAKRNDIDVRIKVESAYPKTGMTRFASPVKFPRVIYSTARSEPLGSGRPVQVKRH